MTPNSKRTRQIALVLILCSCALSVVWGSLIARNSSGGLTDFKAIYYGSRCLIQHADPYKDADYLRVFLADGGKIPAEPMMAELFRRSVLVCINLPSTLFLFLPLACLPVVTAYALWAVLVTIALNLSAYLMWDLAADKAPRFSLLLACYLVANCVILFADGNAASLVISLCVIAVWCFLKDRFIPAGVICLALSLAIKPHDAGLVWLYFLLAGGLYRKRAMQTLLVTMALCVPAILLMAHSVPHWLPELRSNLHVASAHGGLNDPGPASIDFHHPDPIINLQTLISIFRDDPRIYIPASYVISGALLILWGFATLRSRLSQHKTWLALAAIAALTMLVTYHRQHDAKLLLLTLPACAMLWAERSRVGWFALIANSAAILMTGDIPATGLTILTAHLPLGAGLLNHIKIALLVRPAPILLLALSIFYICVYLRRAESEQESRATETQSGRTSAVFESI